MYKQIFFPAKQRRGKDGFLPLRVLLVQSERKQLQPVFKQHTDSISCTDDFLSKQKFNPVNIHKGVSHFRLLYLYLLTKFQFCTLRLYVMPINLF